MTSFRRVGVVRLCGGCPQWLMMFARLIEITGRVSVDKKQSSLLSDLANLVEHIILGFLETGDHVSVAVHGFSF